MDDLWVFVKNLNDLVIVVKNSSPKTVKVQCQDNVVDYPEKRVLIQTRCTLYK